MSNREAGKEMTGEGQDDEIDQPGCLKRYRASNRISVPDLSDDGMEELGLLGEKSYEVRSANDARAA